jgi:uncharacterized protein YodC (DUF2158 family)
MAEIRPGDLVQQKSGGPKITVEHLMSVNGREMVLCVCSDGEWEQDHQKI